MKTRTVKDMTSGSPIKLICQFFVPLLFGILFQQFYSMMDSIIVGKTLGTKEFAAVGGTGSINFMVLGFCMGVCSGFAIPVAQAVGAKKEDMIRKFVANGIWLSIAFSLIMTISVCFYCYDILVLMKTPADIMDSTYRYIYVIFLGIPVTFLYNLLSGILRSLGDSKVPLYFLVFSSVLNIVLDLIFILVIHMGVAGAAWATVISQLISGILCIWYIKKHYPILHIKKEEWKMNGTIMGKLCMVGIPMGLQYSITAIGSVILQTAVNSLGFLTVAAVSAGNRINMLLCCPFDAMGSTMATYVGQNRGAHEWKRITKGCISCCKIAFCYSIVIALITFFFGKPLSLMYLDAKEVKAISEAVLFLHCLSLFAFPLALVNIFRFSIQGMGYSVLAILSGILEMVGRSVIAFVFIPKYGFIAACFAHPTAWVLADLFLVPTLFILVRRCQKKFGNN